MQVALGDGGIFLGVSRQMDLRTVCSVNTFLRATNMELVEPVFSMRFASKPEKTLHRA
jgi:hypothetical protein